jgi:hypothetical protein
MRVTLVPQLRRPSLPFLRRAAGACCTLLVALLLLGQPVLCIVHCAVSGATTSHRHHDPSTNPLSFFLCDAPQAAQAELSVLPYWPAVLPLLLSLRLLRQLLRRLTPPSPASLRTLSWAPPLPPPRLALP